MSDYWNGKYYRQSFNRDGDNFSLVGDRVAVHSVWVTDEEDASLNEMRSNYSSVVSELNSYKEKELDEKKENLFNSEDYNGIKNTEDFAELKKHSKEYSLDELSEKLDKIISKSVKNGTFSFSNNEHEKKLTHVNFAQKLVDEKPKKNSFLDGLLNC